MDAFSACFVYFNKEKPHKKWKTTGLKLSEIQQIHDLALFDLNIRLNRFQKNCGNFENNQT